MVQGVELNYNISASAMQMAQLIFGDRVTVLSASYTGDSRASAIYSNGDSISPGVVPSDTGVILSTGDARAFTRVGTQSNVSSSTTTTNSGPNREDDFDDLSGTATYDASFLEVDFIPDAGTEFITMEFVFSSEEYPEYATSIYNDMVGVWINGEIVPLAAGTGQTSVTNINLSGAQNLFISNTGDQYNTEMDGFTVSMSLTIPVIAGQTNSIKIGIVDVSDDRYDSNVLIAADSVQGSLVAVTDDVLLRPDTSKIVNVLKNDINLTGGEAWITHINGIAVSPGDSVTLTTGQTITLTADNKLAMVGNSESEDVAFTYGVTSSAGDYAVGFVLLDTVPCFVAGTTIRTARGGVPVERLEPGDLVATRDDGLQPIRWIGRRVLPAEGPMAPVRIAENTFGEHRTLLISPHHRILMQSEHAELLYGSHEVLVAAHDLVDGRSIRQVQGGMVEYVHILFDRHQIVWSEGLESESFLPGPQTTNCFDARTVAEICQIFPELDPASGNGYGPAARPALKRFEARLLVA